MDALFIVPITVREDWNDLEKLFRNQNKIVYYSDEYNLNGSASAGIYLAQPFCT